MTLALSIISLVSLATTGALLIYVARLLRDERERTQARVAVLSAAIWREDAWPATAQVADYASAADSDLPLSHDPHKGETLATTEPLEDAQSTPVFPSNAPPLLFADALSDGRSGSPRRWIAPAVGVLVVTVLVAAGTLTTMNSHDRSAPANVTDARLHDAPLQLLSLRHQRDGQSLTVSGLVKNPTGAPAQEHTDVVVFTFDRAGAFITSVRAALADPSLAGGSESPFSATVPNGANVSRYRISFRTGNRMLPHVDRRQDAPSGRVDTPGLPTPGTDDRSVRSRP
jgi:hypothetical protein